MKTKLTIYIGAFFILTGCALFNPDVRYVPKASDEYYFHSLSDDFKIEQSECIEQKNFPCDFPEPNDSLSDFVNSWYSKHLKSLKEPILINNTDNNLKVFRYTNLGSFSHPYTFRVEFKDSIVTINYKITKGLGGYKAGRLSKNNQKTLTITDWDILTEKIDSINYWKMQTHDTNMMLDGEEWILEGLIGDKYHFVTRTSPGFFENKDYVMICKFIAELYRKD